MTASAKLSLTPANQSDRTRPLSHSNGIGAACIIFNANIGQLMWLATGLIVEQAAVEWGGEEQNCAPGCFN